MHDRRIKSGRNDFALIGVEFDVAPAEVADHSAHGRSELVLQWPGDTVVGRISITG